MNKTINTKQEPISNFEEHLKIPFPRVSGNDELQDIKGELSLYGNHVAGFVSSYLKDAEIPFFRSNELREFNMLK